MKVSTPETYLIPVHCMILGYILIIIQTERKANLHSRWMLLISMRSKYQVCIWYSFLDFIRALPFRNNIGTVRVSKQILRFRSILIGQRLSFSSGASSFENILGISSIEVTGKNRHSATGDGYPFEGSVLDNANNAKKFLKFDHAKIIAQVAFSYFNLYFLLLLKCTRHHYWYLIFYF